MLVLVLTLDLTTDGATLAHWLGRRGLAFVGELAGAIETFRLTDDGMVSFTSHRGDLLLHTSVERYVLQLVREAYRRNGYRSIIEFRDWLSSIGLEIVSTG